MSTSGFGVDPIKNFFIDNDEPYRFVFSTVYELNADYGSDLWSSPLHIYTREMPTAISVAFVYNS